MVFSGKPTGFMVLSIDRSCFPIDFSFPSMDRRYFPIGLVVLPI
jgi:hypothetical protein